MHIGHKCSPEILDLLATPPSKVSFTDRVRQLNLSSDLEQKVLRQEGRLPKQGDVGERRARQLSVNDEQELATEMLLLRHRFTELVVHSSKFRQAALTIVQNIYLFRNRKIFFGTPSSASTEEERQEALCLFSANPSQPTLTLAKTFQHLILARVWNRILSLSTDADFRQPQFTELQSVVERLNTVRNVYMLMTSGLVKKLATRINDIYKQSITYDDAIQIGSIGIARAAYRYHQSSGIRFSTFAANWVFKEIQRQALEGRLIRLSVNTVERYTRAAKEADPDDLCTLTAQLQHVSIVSRERVDKTPSVSCFLPELDASSPATNFESRELKTILLRAIDHQLSGKSADIIKRRYGFPPYQGKEQSVIAISRDYGVTRGSIYQLEQAGLKKLGLHLQAERVTY